MLTHVEAFSCCLTSVNTLLTWLTNKINTCQRPFECAKPLTMVWVVHKLSPVFRGRLQGCFCWWFIYIHKGRWSHTRGLKTTGLTTLNHSPLVLALLVQITLRICHTIMPSDVDDSSYGSSDRLKGGDSTEWLMNYFRLFGGAFSGMFGKVVTCFFWHCSV